MSRGKLVNQKGGKVLFCFFLLGAQSRERGGSRRVKGGNRKARSLCSVQFCPAGGWGWGSGGTVKAMVDAHAPVSSQQRAAEETAFLGLICDLDSLTAPLRVVALL